MKKCKIQGQVTTLEMPFSYNRKSTNFSSTHVRICVKDTTPLQEEHDTPYIQEEDLFLGSDSYKTCFRMLGFSSSRDY